MNKIRNFFTAYPVVAATILVGAVAGILWSADTAPFSQGLVTVFAGGFALWTAFDMIRDMIRGHFGLDVLALMAIVSTLVVGEYWASLVVVLMLSGGEALEDFAEGRATSELTALLDRSPTTAHLLDDSGETTDVDVDQVKVGDKLLIRPADVVPVDCILAFGTGTFDESSITGESMPVTVEAGGEIPSGAVNGPNAVTVHTLRKSADSQYQQIVRLVQASEDAKAPIVRLADRFAVPFTLIAVLIASVAFAVSGDPVRFAEVLVLATPCPLLIAAPVAFMGGMSRSAQAGIVVKGGAALEQAARAGSLAFDKTGTLTAGRPQVVELQPAPGFDDAELLLLAASAEQYSSHVLAEGIRAAAEGIPLLEVDGAHEVNSQGVTGTIKGQTVTVGRFGFVQSASELTTQADLTAGQAVVYVARDDQYVGAVLLADEIRPESKAVIGWLKENGVGRVAMLTGDSQGTADMVAAAINIDEVHASLHPADKVEIAAGMKPKPSMMVGDGINDAPVLAAADVGVAMGARGSTAAGEAADAVILRDSLVGVANLVSISRDTIRVALTAIWIGIVLSIGLMLVATTGVIPAVVGAGLQEILDLVAILYALRALTGKLPEIEEQPSPCVNTPWALGQTDSNKTQCPCKEEGKALCAEVSR